MSERDTGEPERVTPQRPEPGAADARPAPARTDAVDDATTVNGAEAPPDEGVPEPAGDTKDPGQDTADPPREDPAAPKGRDDPAAPEGHDEAAAPKRAEGDGAREGAPTSSSDAGSEEADEPAADPAGTHPPKDGPAPRHRHRRGLVTTVTVVGELLITAGVVLGLFVVYSLWWTNVEANREARRQSEQVRAHWREQGPGGPEQPSDLDLKDGIGFLHVPAMSDEPILVKLGTDPKELNDGVAGVYQKPVKAAMPWDRSGNFSLAAHRDGHGAKFHNIHRIDVGDPMVFETRNTWYVYRAYAKLPKTSKYNVDVLDPVPRESGKKKPGRYLTLTTCTPIFTSDHRYVVWGELVRTEDVDAERTPPKELR